MQAIPVVCDPGEHFHPIKSRGGLFKLTSRRVRSAFVDDEAVGSDADASDSGGAPSKSNISDLIDDDDVSNDNGLHPSQQCSAALHDSDVDDTAGPSGPRQVLDDDDDAAANAPEAAPAAGAAEVPPPRAAPAARAAAGANAPGPAAAPDPPAANGAAADRPPGQRLDFSGLEELLDDPADKAKLRRLLPKLSGPVRSTTFADDESACLVF